MARSPGQSSRRRWFTAAGSWQWTGRSTTVSSWPGAGRDFPVALVNSLNPHRLAGQKTAAFEIVDDLGDAPDVHVLPVGNGGNISAYWMGYQEYAANGPATRCPRM